MLPLVFLPDTPVLLAGRGAALRKRLDMLEAAGQTMVTVHAEDADAALRERLGPCLRNTLPTSAEIAGVRLVFAAGLDAAASRTIAEDARRHGVPVNVEDVPPLCDFHVPAAVRRGRLTLTVSTAGGAPALAAAIRAWLADAFGPEWADRLEDVAALRAKLRDSGAAPAEVVRGIGDYLAASGWPPLSDLSRCSTVMVEAAKA